MKKSILVVMLLLFATQFASAATHKKKKKPKNSSPISYISMHRTACFGRCPDYLLEVNGNGIAKYFGYMFTQHQGVYQKKMSAAQVADLFQQFAKYRVDTCQDNYPTRITDVPSIIFNIEYNGTRKKINNANFGPPFLIELAQAVDNIAAIDDSWTKIADTARR